MNTRNNYQIMHVELVFLNPEPLKENSENTATRVYKTEKVPVDPITQGLGEGGLRLWLRVSLGILRGTEWRVYSRCQGFQDRGCHQMTRCPGASRFPS